jgi:hypothetical protein
MVRLEFQGSFGLARRDGGLLFDQPVAKQAGVYLWAAPYAHGGYLPLYVGESRTLGLRVPAQRYNIRPAAQRN